MKTKQKNKKGFSLIEIVIYIAIFSMVSLLVIKSLSLSMKSFAATRTNIILEEAGLNSIERISREIRASNSIDLVNSDLSNGILKLNSLDASGAPMDVQISNDNGKLDLYEGGVLLGNLLGANVTLENLSFSPISTTHSQGLKVNISIKSNYGASDKQANFYDTLILRGSYK